ncbi:MAG: DUF3016 domain-containing protein [Acidovorax sp.]
MKLLINHQWAAPALALLLAACATAPAGDPEPGAVSVTTTNPAYFSDATVHPRDPDRQRWVDALSSYLAERAAAALPRGQRLDVRITDVRRISGSGARRVAREDTKVMTRVVYPPQIDLDFVLRDEDGKALRQGRRTLRDDTFVQRLHEVSSDPLYAEKRLIDTWVAREFGPVRAPGPLEQPSP